MTSLDIYLNAYNELRPKLDAIGFDKGEHHWFADGVCSSFWVDHDTSPMPEPKDMDIFHGWEPRFTVQLVADPRFRLMGQRMQQSLDPFWCFTLAFVPDSKDGWGYPAIEYRDLLSLDDIPETPTRRGLIGAMKDAARLLP